MILTEYIGNWCPDNHKKPRDPFIQRKNHNFKSLFDLALWSRVNYFLAFPQKETNEKRKKFICDKLFIGTKLLWIDADYDVDIQDVKKRWLKANLRGFFYFTSRYYIEGTKRLRICVKVEGLTLKNAQSYALEVKKILNLQQIDTSKYGSETYYAPVMVNNTNPRFRKNSLWIHEGKTLKLEIKINKDKSKKTQKSRSSKLKQRELLSFSKFLNTLSCVKSTTVRDNNTVNIIFKHIKEKTENGYFINPYIDPWKVSHPNNKRLFANEVFRDDFLKYKNYILEHFQVHQPASDIGPDIIIQSESKYLKSSVFNARTKLLFVESPTGSGKSTAIAKCLLKQKDKSILFIAVNRAQAIQTHRSLIQQGLNFECYLPSDISTAQQAVKDGSQYYLSEFILNARSGIIPQKLICGVLSLHHLINDMKLLRTFDYVIIDEITTLPRSTNGVVSLLAEHHQRFNKDMTALYFLLRNAEKVICLDAYIPKAIIKAIENISGKESLFIRKEFKTNKLVDIYLTKDSRQPKLDGKITCNGFMNQLNTDIKANNEILLIGLSSKKKAHELNNYIKLKSKKNIELITNRLNQKKDILNFIKHLDKKLIGTNIMIYSPSITTGVDIPQAKDTNVYHLIMGKHLSAHIHYQMTMRGRDAQRYLILMPTYLFNNTGKPVNSKKRLYSNIFKLHELSQTSACTKELLNTAIKNEGMGMGVVLAYHLLNSKGNKSFDIKGIKRQVKTQVGVYTATRLELANIALNSSNKSVGDQYIDLLKHEGCKISEQLDATYRRPEDRIKEITEEIKLLKLPVTAKTETSLYVLKKKYLFVQKILHFHNGYHRSTDTTKFTYKIIRKALKIARLNFSIIIRKVPNELLIEIYNSIAGDICLTQNKACIDKLILNKFDDTELSDATKIKRVAYLLNLFFTTARKHRNSKVLIVEKNVTLSRSVQGMTEQHLKLLYVTDEVSDEM